MADQDGFKAEGAALAEKILAHADPIHRETYSLYDKMEKIGKTAAIIRKINEGRGSAQGVNIGEQPRPFDFSVAKSLQQVNGHHNTCILTKRDVTVGVGFMTEEMRNAAKAALAVTEPKPGESASVTEVNPVETEVDKALDGFCDESFNDVLSASMEDYWSVAVGYIEVVRKGDQIVGLWHIPSEEVTVFVEDTSYNYHYVVLGKHTGFSDKRFCKFGDKKRFLATTHGKGRNEDDISEVIRFRQPSSQSRWYSVPDWLPAVSDIELLQALKQYKFDFFMNRGVPEFMLFVLGETLPDAVWSQVTASLQKNVGFGNSHKSLAVNLGNPEIKIQLEKLMLETGGTEEEFTKTKEALDLALVSAHRTPPLLAGIMIPGKLGALNELPNSLMAFQTLVIGPTQLRVQRVLGRTLGNTKASGLSLKPEDFQLRRVTDVIDPATMDTVSRMRQTVPEAKAEGRDLSAGTKD